MRGDADAVYLIASETFPNPSRLRRDTFSRKWEKDEPTPSWEMRMVFHRPDSQLRRARAMRSAPTKAEEMLWRSLRSSGIGMKFRRQVPIGPYIADFACLAVKLVLELDGPLHHAAEQQARDHKRDAWFHTHGWRVLRIPNEIVFGGGDIVIDQIKWALSNVPSSDLASRGHLLPQAGEGQIEDVF